MTEVLDKIGDIANGIIDIGEAYTDVFFDTVLDNDKKEPVYNDSSYKQAIFLYETYKIDVPVFSLLFSIPDKIIIDYTSKLNDFINLESNMIWKLLNYDSGVVKTTSDTVSSHSDYKLSNGHIKVFLIILMFSTSFSMIKIANIIKRNV